MRGVDFRIRISPRVRSQNRNVLKGSVRDLGQSDLCKIIGKTGSLPCPFVCPQGLRRMWKNCLEPVEMFRQRSKYSWMYSDCSFKIMFLFPVIPGFTGQNELFPIACYVDSAYGECYSALFQKMVNLKLSKMTCIDSDSRWTEEWPYHIHVAKTGYDGTYTTHARQIPKNKTLQNAEPEFSGLCTCSNFRLLSLHILCLL